MALQRSLAVIPPNAHVVSSRLAVLIDDGKFVAYSATDPIYTCRVDDHDGMRLASGMLSGLKLAPDTALTKALGMSRVTVRRNRNLLRAGGVEAVHCRRYGPKGPHKLTGLVQIRAQRCLDQGWPVCRVAREVRLTEGASRRAIRQGCLQRRFEARVGRPASEQAPVPVVRPARPRNGRMRTRPASWAWPPSAG